MLNRTYRERNAAVWCGTVQCTFSCSLLRRISLTLWGGTDYPAPHWNLELGRRKGEPCNLDPLRKKLNIGLSITSINAANVSLDTANETASRKLHIVSIIKVIFEIEGIKKFCKMVQVTRYHL